MYSSLQQMADFFIKFIDHEDYAVDEIIMHPDVFPVFYEQNKKYIDLSGAPWLSGEIVGYIWGASLRLSNGVGRNQVNLLSFDRCEVWHEQEMVI